MREMFNARWILIFEWWDNVQNEHVVRWMNSNRAFFPYVRSHNHISFTCRIFISLCVGTDASRAFYISCLHACIPIAYAHITKGDRKTMSYLLSHIPYRCSFQLLLHIFNLVAWEPLHILLLLPFLHSIQCCHCVITLKFYYAFNVGIQLTKLFIRDEWECVLFFDSMRYTCERERDWKRRMWNEQKKHRENGNNTTIEKIW